MESVRIMATLVDGDVARGVAAFAPRAAMRRQVSFCETRPPVGLALRGAGLFVELTGRAGATITLRPCRPDRFPDPWRHQWRTPGHDYRICAVLTHDRWLVEASLAGPPAFSDRQRSFLADCGPMPVDLTSLVELGPVDVCRWRVRRHGFTVDVRRLQVAGSPAVLELSVVAPPGDARLVRPAFGALLRRNGLDPAGMSRTGVEIVLEQLLRSA